MPNYQGQCFCGNIHFECSGEPLFTQYCHCHKCREVAAMSKRSADQIGYGWTAAYLTSAFEITRGKDKLEGIIRNQSQLFLCQNCHCLIYGMALDPEKQAGIGINANNFALSHPIPLSFIPVRHVWYVNRLTDFNDQLEKYKDAPKEQFGSGELF